MSEKKFLTWDDEHLTQFIEALQKDSMSDNEIAEAIVTYHHYSKNSGVGDLQEDDLVRILDDQIGITKLSFKKNIRPRFDNEQAKTRLRIKQGLITYRVLGAYCEDLKEKYLVNKYLPFLTKRPLPDINESNLLINLSDLKLNRQKGLPSKLIPELIKEANYNYYCEFYSSCALICRRIFEILIIEALEIHNSSNPDDPIQIESDRGEYLGLGALIGKFKSRSFKGVDQSVKNCLDHVKKYGDIGAHHRFTSVDKNQINLIRPDIAMTVKVLLQLGRFF